MLETIRGSVRPVVTAGSIAATISFIIMGIVPPVEWWPLQTMIIAWWFQTRDQKPANGGSA